MHESGHLSSSFAQSRDTITQNSIRTRAYDGDRRDLLDTRRPPCDTKSVGRLFWKKRRSPRGSGIVYSVAMPGFIVSRARDVPSRSRLNLACRFTAGADIGIYIYIYIKQFSRVRNSTREIKYRGISWGRDEIEEGFSFSGVTRVTGRSFSCHDLDYVTCIFVIFIAVKKKKRKKKTTLLLSFRTRLSPR